jgi:hypothetical protein
MKRPFAEQYESIGKNQRRTKGLNQHIYRLAKKMTFTDVAKLFIEQHTPISDCTVGRIYHAFVRIIIPAEELFVVWVGKPQIN